MNHILFYLSLFLKEVSLFKRRWIHYYLYEKFKSEFVTNESFASFIAIRSDFLWSARPLYGEKFQY